MKLLVTDDHIGEGNFTSFPKGTPVKNLEPAEGYTHWMSCTIGGKETFIPDSYIVDGKLAVDYNPTELVLNKGDIVELEKIVYEWFIVKTGNGSLGWFPAGKLISINGK